MPNGTKDPYEFVNFNRYRSAQDMYNENMSIGGTQNFYDYDNDGLLDNFPVSPEVTENSKSVFNQPTARNTQRLISIPGGIGTYNATDTLNTMPSIPDILYPVTPPAYSGSNTKFPGFFSRLGASNFGQNLKSNLSSPQAIAGLAGGIGGVLQGLIGRRKRRDAQREAQTQYDKMLDQYRNLDTSNLYANVENQYANMENTMEDLTVNQQQARFQAQQNAQQRANIMSNLQGAAGGSGIASLAQALANQGQLATQQASASIGMQESKIQQLQAREASRLQQLERTGETRAEAMRLAGAERARSLEYQLAGTELGMAQQDLAAKNRAKAQGEAALYGGIGSLIGTVAGAGIGGL